MKFEKMDAKEKYKIIPFGLIVGSYCLRSSIKALREGKIHVKENRQNVTYFRKTTPAKFWLSVGINIFISVASISLTIYAVLL